MGKEVEINLAKQVMVYISNGMVVRMVTGMLKIPPLKDEEGGGGEGSKK
jgi:hypothetical protein